MKAYCSICSDPLDSPKHTPVFLPCGHTYHGSCCNTWLELSQKCPLCLRYTTKLNVHTLYISTESSPKLDNTDLKKVVELFKAKQSEYKKLLKEAKVTNKQLVSEIKAHKRRTSRSSRLLQHVVEAHDKSLTEIGVKVRDLNQQKALLDRKKAKIIRKSKKREIMFSEYNKQQDIIIDKFRLELEKTREKLKEKRKRSFRVDSNLKVTLKHGFTFFGQSE
ncbi:uncharacterized protein EV154DRAFT_506265 [Mucor mucedo]|uniref:uncharacterized protein n=1 Tax=Mucor mucedo TaxID=29922 RepID=UPI0022201CB9|nr:uncharacterized protein EV154DRAFT_506265 [Mucor mucedo]KAI7892089.1 hypothetical protein EV154DRAFT_506265 [Mucor mucedo]